MQISAFAFFVCCSAAQVIIGIISETDSASQ